MKGIYSQFERHVGSSFYKVRTVRIFFMAFYIFLGALAFFTFIIGALSTESSAYISSFFKISFTVIVGPYLYSIYLAAKKYDISLLSERVKNSENTPSIDSLPVKFSLYLRSFEHEFSSVSCLDWTCDHEAALISALTQDYPLVTVGNPGLDLQPLGTQRLHLHTDAWEDRVKLLISRSEFVVIRADHSDSVVWEIKSSISLSPPEKIKIMLNAEAQSDDYLEFKKKVESLFPKGLPDFATDAAFIVFDSEWNPQLLKFNEENSHKVLSSRIAAVLANHLGVIPKAIRNSEPDIERIDSHIRIKKYPREFGQLPSSTKNSHYPPKLW